MIRKMLVENLLIKQEDLPLLLLENLRDITRKINEVIDVVNGHEVFFESMRGVDKSEVKKHGED